MQVSLVRPGAFVTVTAALNCIFWSHEMLSPVGQITVNRAPVLMLWATVVAERLGCDRDYERFRPEVPAGERGWGAKGVLDLRRIAGAAQ